MNFSSDSVPSAAVHLVGQPILHYSSFLILFISQIPPVEFPPSELSPPDPRLAGRHAMFTHLFWSNHAGTHTVHVLPSACVLQSCILQRGRSILIIGIVFDQINIAGAGDAPDSDIPYHRYYYSQPTISTFFAECPVASITGPSLSCVC